MAQPPRYRFDKTAFLGLLERRGIDDPHLLQAMAQVPREDFVSDDWKGHAYDDSPLPIAAGQTISQPYIVARMIQALAVQPGDRVLEIGSGSGYSSAILAELADAVWAIERQPELLKTASERLRRLGYTRVRLRCGDGTRGWPEHAPFDAILVSAGGPEVPASLIAQLAPGGRLVMPVGNAPDRQQLLLLTRGAGDAIERENLGDVRFVPLIGAEGWEEGAGGLRRPASPAAKAPRAAAGASPGSAETQAAQVSGAGNGASAGHREAAGRPDLPEASAVPLPQNVIAGRDMSSAGGASLPGAGPGAGAAPSILTSPSAGLPARIRAVAEPFNSIDGADLGPLLQRIGDARLVLLGEASHGSREFHDMRARISRELITHHGFDFIAVEADWPDASHIDHYLRGHEVRRGERAFTRFPTWMWANRSVLDFLRWLRGRNEGLPDSERTGFFGLDLYSLYGSIDEVLRYLDSVDPELKAYARERYACLDPWRQDLSGYASASLRGRHADCERDVLAMLEALLNKRLELTAADRRGYFDAVANARLVRHAEAYYRAVYQGSTQSWNLRDRHMFATLQHLLDYHGPRSRAIVWAHNSHLGDARATEMHERGQINLGALCRERYGNQVFLLGFGTHGGSVAAASAWGGPMDVKEVQPSRPDSYERLCHDSGQPCFLLGLGRDAELRLALEQPRLQRAIGVIYRPETERWSHYFRAVLPRQFDEYVWFSETHAVEPLFSEQDEKAGDVAETYPFGL